MTKHELGKKERELNTVPAERSLLGGLLEDPGQLPVISTMLSERDFYAPHHGATFGLLCRMAVKGIPIDVVSVNEAIGADPKSHDGHGGLGYVAQLPEQCPSTANLLHYVAIIVEHSRLRRLRELSTTLYNAAHGSGAYSDMPASEIADEWVPRLLELSVNRGSRRTSSSLAEAWTEAEDERLDDDAGALPPPLMTGFGELDKLAQCRPGDLVVIGGETGMGKSALAQALTMEFGAQGGRVVYCSLEMPRRRLARRLAAYWLSIPTENLRTGNLTPEGERNRDKFTELLEKGELPVHLTDKPRMSIDQVAAESRMIWGQGGLRAVFVDHLHLMNHGRWESRTIAIGETTSRAKQLALDLQVPVFLLAQLNRTAAKRDDPRGATRKGERSPPWWETVAVPRLSDLRDSGAIEQDADLVLFPIHASRCGRAESQYARSGAVIVAKQRDGGLGTVAVEWDGPCASYRPLQAPLFDGVR